MKNPINYCCSFCGRRNLKLWRPKEAQLPLVCAECAENRQTTGPCCAKVEEIMGRRLFVPRWEVNEQGEIPSCVACGNARTKSQMTNCLYVKLDTGVCTELIPALPRNDGQNETVETNEWWEKLPTR